MHLASRYHDFSAGHRVVGHESKCRFLHGHNYRIHFFCAHEGGRLDTIGRVIDFSVIKEKLCTWLEDFWDHKFLIWEKDPLRNLNLSSLVGQGAKDFVDSFIVVPFNPTAENMAHYLIRTVGPLQLAGTDVRLKRVIVEETRKCSVELGE